MPTHFRDPDYCQIIAEHGRGGLGRVPRAHDRELWRDVAIKKLLSRGYVSEGRFLREALITDRRHRALALSGTTAVVLAATGGTPYVRHIAAERRIGHAD